MAQDAQAQNAPRDHNHDAESPSPNRKRSRSPDEESSSKRVKSETNGEPPEDRAERDSQSQQDLSEHEQLASSNNTGTRSISHNHPPRAELAVHEVIVSSETVETGPKDEREASPVQDAPRPRRRPDEGQRAKRLFGALLNLNTKQDERKAQRRREIETRKRNELRRQDDEQLEDEQRRFERVMRKRGELQKEVDKENMHVRHRNMLHTAHFLRTTAEPRLYYLPWTLRPDEDDLIDDQIDDVRALIETEKKASSATSALIPDEAHLEAREEKFVKEILHNGDCDDSPGNDEGRQKRQSDKDTDRASASDPEKVILSDEPGSSSIDNTVRDLEHEHAAITDIETDVSREQSAQPVRSSPATTSAIIREDDVDIDENDDDMNHDGDEDAVIY